MASNLFRPLVERVPFKTGDLPRCVLDVVIRVGNTYIRSDVIRLQSFEGTEGISQPFEFQLDLRANDYTHGGRNTFDALEREKAEFDEGDAPFITNYSHDLDRYPNYGTDLGDPANDEEATDVAGVPLNFDDLLGGSVTVSIALPVAGVAPEHQTRTFFNGIITSVSMAESGSYEVVMKPKLALLGMQSHYRAFQSKTILDVIESVLQENGIAVSAEAVFSTPNGEQSIVSGLAIYRTQDWLQAGETDLDFIDRLMEKTGLFYYFIHDQNKHTMVLTDQCYYQSLWEEGEEGALRKLYLSSTEGTQDKEYYITEYKLQQNLVPQGVSIVLAQRQAAWESQDTANISPRFDDVAGVQRQDYLTMVQPYAVAYGASEEELQIRKLLLEKQLSASKTSLTGSSTCSELKSGYKFQVAESYAAEHPSLEWDKDMVPPTVRPELNGMVMVATSVTHKASIDGKYSNQFTAVKSSAFAKPFMPAGNNQATILAEVCSSPSSTVTTDPVLNRQFLVENEDFLDVEFNSFQSIDNGVTQFQPKGLYVRLITQTKYDTPIWACLSDTMTTIPERGAMVLVGRSSDETEIPEIQQVIEAKGSRTIMPSGYTLNTTKGDTRSASYGDSYRVSLSNSAATTDNINHAEGILTDAYNRSVGPSSFSFDDVSVSASSSLNVNHTNTSYSFTANGPLPTDKDLHQMLAEDANQNIGSWDDYCQITSSISYKKTYSKNVSMKDTESVSIEHGNSSTTSTSFGKTYNNTTNYGESENITTHTGLQRSTSQLNRTENITTQSAVSNITATGASNTQDVTGVSTSTTASGVSTSVTVNGVTNAINLTGITSTLDIAAITNNISRAGPGFRVDDSSSRPSAGLESFSSKILLGIKCFL